MPDADELTLDALYQRILRLEAALHDGFSVMDSGGRRHEKFGTFQAIASDVKARRAAHEETETTRRLEAALEARKARTHASA
jgi:hypothetical protein